MDRVKFLDFFIDNFSMEEILEKADYFIASGKPRQLVAINAAKVVKMRHDAELADIVRSSGIVFADGQSVVWASGFLGFRLKQRVAGIDLMQELVKRAARKGYRIYFLGAKKDVVEKLADVYKKDFPGINIAGWHDGYFKEGEEERAVLDDIKMSRPDILFVAMETPKKEYWIRDNLEYLQVPVCMGVGGSFDVAAGFTKRAPLCMQRSGLEWFFRFLKEPGRMWKRYLVTNSLFIWFVLKEKFNDTEKRHAALPALKIILCFFLAVFSFLQGSALSEEEKSWSPFYIPWNYCEGSKADVGFLLDAPAGKYGFLKARNGHFYFENSRKMKFWGVNIHSSNACFPNHGQAEDIARRLRQLGCNIVRMHLLDNEEPLGVIDAGYNDTQHLSESQMERLDYFVYQLKKNGIYVCFDVLGLGARRFKLGDGVQDFSNIKPGSKGVSFFNQRIIELSRKFALDFLSHKNPYTGNSYLNEPAVAMVEMTNENTLFDEAIKKSISPYYQNEISNMWAAWLKEKGKTPGDSRERWSQDREFMFELQDSYQKDMYNYLRSIGVKVPIGSSNSQEDILTLAADNSMDFTDTHPYWDHVALTASEFRIHNRPMIRQSHLNPCTILNTIARARIKGKPCIVTEWDSMWPNDWRAADILTTASYAILNDFDALFLYAYNGGWEMSWDGLGQKLYYPTVVFNDPATMGIFPLGALIFLRGDPMPAKNSYSVYYNVNKLFREFDMSQDIQRLAGIAYSSRLERVFLNASSGGSEKSATDYSGLPEKAKGLGIVQSDTGEISRDFKKGVFTLDTPRTVSFSGFIGGGKTHDSGVVRFISGTDFATIIMTSLDGKDLGSSGHLLLGAIGRARNKGQKLAPHKSKNISDLSRDVYVLNKGAGPILIESIDGEVLIKNRRLTKVFSLDENGLRKSEIRARRDRDAISFNISGKNRAIYYEIIQEVSK